MSMCSPATRSPGRTSLGSASRRPVPPVRQRRRSSSVSPPDVKTATGAAAFTPVPAQQTDTNNAGWAVARPRASPPRRHDAHGLQDHEERTRHPQHPGNGRQCHGCRLQDSGEHGPERCVPSDRHFRHPPDASSLGDRSRPREQGRSVDTAHSLRRRGRRGALVRDRRKPPPRPSCASSPRSISGATLERSRSTPPTRRCQEEKINLWTWRRSRVPWPTTTPRPSARS